MKHHFKQQRQQQTISQMSLTVPYSTQIGPYPSSADQTQSAFKLYIVYSDGLTREQTDLLKDAQAILSERAYTAIVTKNEVLMLPTTSRYFIIPNFRDDLIELIKSHANKPIIYTARTVIEALKYKQVPLPSRTLAVSLAMLNCHVFLAKSYNVVNVRSKIHAMSAVIVPDINDLNLNVVVTDRSDNKYCFKARARNVVAVSIDWIDETFRLSTSDDSTTFNHDAISTLSYYKVKVFHGLKFKIALPQLGIPLKNLIIDNGGKLVFGDEEKGITHVVVRSLSDRNQSNGYINANCSEPEYVDVEFLETCVSLGYYPSRKEYNLIKESSCAMVKQEPRSQLSASRSSNSTQNHQKSTPSMTGENQSMLPPPPSIHRQTRQQISDSMNELILRELENGTQTQRAPSTQIRRLPDPEIRVEQNYEPSQQLYWNEQSFSRRH